MPIHFLNYCSDIVSCCQWCLLTCASERDSYCLYFGLVFPKILFTIASMIDGVL